MMKTICIAGLKGGIGKTTTTTTLAYLLQAEKEKRVLLIDADCQANATMTYDVETSDDGIADIMSYVSAVTVSAKVLANIIGVGDRQWILT